MRRAIWRTEWRWRLREALISMRQRIAGERPPNPVVWMATAYSMRISAESMCSTQISVLIEPLPGNNVGETRTYGPFEYSRIYSSRLLDRCCMAYMSEFPDADLPE